jgi:hypothetical protein
MALNPFFLQGSKSEQNLVQQLINEQLRMYGVEIIYMPRRFISERIVIKENVLSKFDENYAIEAYVSNYQGFGGGGDILSKFGVQSKDELTLVISKERFEDFISPFMIDADGNVKEDFKLATRPKEGDLIYFPLSDTIFEIKFVEHEREFYQLNKLYVYELVCEAFEYEDEIINTGIEEVDDNFAERGYAAKLTLVGIGQTATAITTLRSGSVSKIYVNKTGYGYKSTPTIAIGSPPAGGTNATAVAIMTNRSVTGFSTAYSVKSIQITNPGAGYTVAPTIRFIGGSGTGAIATAGISTTGSVGIVTITNGGDKYVTIPTVTFSSAPAGGVTAIGTATVSAAGTISQIRITDAGSGYISTPSIIISSPSGVGRGNFVLNEVVTGAASSTKAIVKTWDADTLILKVNNVTGTFRLGEIVVGSATTFANVGLGTTGVYMISKIEKMTDTDIDDFESYDQNEEIENAASSIVDFSEKNPFGDY